MKANTCSKYSKVVRSMQYMERKLNEVLDKRSKDGRDNEDNCYQNMTVNSEGERCWSF